MADLCDFGSSPEENLCTWTNLKVAELKWQSTTGDSSFWMGGPQEDVSYGDNLGEFYSMVLQYGITVWYGRCKKETPTFRLHSIELQSPIFCFDGEYLKLNRVSYYRFIFISRSYRSDILYHDTRVTTWFILPLLMTGGYALFETSQIPKRGGAGLESAMLMSPIRNSTGAKGLCVRFWWVMQKVTVYIHSKF